MLSREGMKMEPVRSKRRNRASSCELDIAIGAIRADWISYGCRSPSKLPTGFDRVCFSERWSKRESLFRARAIYLLPRIERVLRQSRSNGLPPWPSWARSVSDPSVLTLTPFYRKSHFHDQLPDREATDVCTRATILVVFSRQRSSMRTRI